MNEDRIQTFTEEIGELKLRGARADREHWLLVLGVVGLVAGKEMIPQRLSRGLNFSEI